MDRRVDRNALWFINALRSTRSARHSAGFTLVEVLIGAALSAAVMAAVLSSYIYMGRGLGRLANQQILETEGRRTIAIFARDARAASDLTTVSTSPTSPAANRVDLVVPTGSGTNTITYYYNSTPIARTPTYVDADTVSVNGINVSMRREALTRCVYNGTTVTSLILLRNIISGGLTIRYYDSSGNEYTTYANYLPGIKQLGIEFSSANGNNIDGSGSSQTATYQAKSARIVLRNRGLLP